MGRAGEDGEERMRKPAPEEGGAGDSPPRPPEGDDDEEDVGHDDSKREDDDEENTNDENEGGDEGDSIERASAERESLNEEGEAKAKNPAALDEDPEELASSELASSELASSELADEDSSDAGSVVEVHDGHGPDKNSECGSVVEVEINEDNLSDTGENALGGEHPLYASLASLVNDRMAEASMNLHAMSGAKLLRTLAYCLLGNLISLVLTSISVAWSNSATESMQGDSNLNIVLFWLVLRVAQSLVMSAVTLLFTYVVIFDLETPDPLSANQDKLRVRKTSQSVVLLCTWCTWLLPALNPGVTVVDLYSFVLARRDRSLATYQDYWPRQRYSVAAESLFVASFFYGTIVLFKWIRIEAIKRENWLRLSLQHDGSSLNMQAVTDSLLDVHSRRHDHVRTVRGVVPRMAALYVASRLAVGEAFNFSMGFVPGTAWISTIRYCAADVPAGAPSPCISYEDNVLTALIIAFSAWELVLMGWIFFEARRARNILSLFYLLQGRANLVSFHVLSAILALQMFFLYLLAIVTEAGLSSPFAFYHGLAFSGVSYGDGPVAIVVLTWATALVYMFLPCNWVLTPRCWRRVQDTGYHYMKSYNEFALGALGDTYVVEHLDVLAEDKEQTEFSSTDMGPGDVVTADAINHCLEHRASNFFSFDIAALLWNFAHTMYLTGTVRFTQSDPDVMLLVEDGEFSLVAQISDESVNVYCAVFASSEMVVVAFRGNGPRIPASFSGARTPRMTDPFAADAAAEDLEAGDPRDLGARLPTDPSRSFGRLVRMNSSLMASNTGKARSGARNCCTWIYRRAGDAFPQLADPPRVRMDLYDRYSLVSDRILAVVQQVSEQKSRPVFATGHGVGGAYASLCALDLARKQEQTRFTHVAVYAFGAPRFGNEAFRNAYNDKVPNHFDIANVSDSLHTQCESRLPWDPPQLARLGTLVLVDSLGSLVLRPDWLETRIMRFSKRKKFNGHEPLAYTTALMQWAHRMYGPYYRPLWTSSLHEVKLGLGSGTSAANVDKMVSSGGSDHGVLHDALEGWQTSVVRSYLRTSQVGLGPYFDEACIRIRVKRITGLHAETSSCIISCGPQGIGSSLWEVGKTKPARLQHRSTLAGLQLTTSAHSPEGLTDLSRKSNRTNLLGLGVDAAALAAMPTRFVDFSESDPMYFGVMQKLRPCASLIIAGVDLAHGNFGSVCLPVTELFPIPLDKPKAVSFELTGRARRENAGELKVHIEVENVGRIPLGALSSSQPVANGEITVPTPRHRNSASSLARWQPDTDGISGGPGPQGLVTAASTLQLSQPMAYFYLKRNFNGNSQRVVLRVGIMKAAMRTLHLVTKDQTPAREIYAILHLGKETGRSRGAKDIHAPAWDELFTFGKLETLTGFEELRVEFYATAEDSAEELRKLEAYGEEHLLAQMPGRSRSIASMGDSTGSLNASHRRASAGGHVRSIESVSGIIPGIAGAAAGASNTSMVGMPGSHRSTWDDLPVFASLPGAGGLGSAGSSTSSLSLAPGALTGSPHGATLAATAAALRTQPAANDRLVGVVELPLSAIITKYQDTMVEHQDAVLVNWESFDPISSVPASSSSPPDKNAPSPRIEASGALPSPNLASSDAAKANKRAGALASRPAESDVDAAVPGAASPASSTTPSMTSSSSSGTSSSSTFSTSAPASRNGPARPRLNESGELPGHVCFAFELATEPLTSVDQLPAPKLRPGNHGAKYGLYERRDVVGSPHGSTAPNGLSGGPAAGCPGPAGLGLDASAGGPGAHRLGAAGFGSGSFGSGGSASGGSSGTSGAGGAGGNAHGTAGPAASSTGGGANNGGSGPGAGNRRRANMVRQASGSLRSIIGLATAPMGANFRMHRSQSGASASQAQESAAVLHRANTIDISSAMLQPESHCIISQSVPEDWKAKAKGGFDERAFVVRVHVHRADQLELQLPNMSHSKSDGLSPTGSLASTASIDLPCVDSYCEISLKDPLNAFEMAQSRRTVIMRDSVMPSWEETFSFGKDRAAPVRGNEILSLAVHHWEMGGKGFAFGEVRLPMRKLQDSLGMKASFTEPLEKYDEEGNILPRAGPVAELSFAILVTEFVHRDSFKSSSEPSPPKTEFSKSPML